jgi:hypothetical protein
VAAPSAPSNGTPAEDDDSRRESSYWWIPLVLAAAGLAVGLLASEGVSRFFPEQFTATAFIMKVEPVSGGIPSTHSATPTPVEFQQSLLDEKVLDRLLKDLQPAYGSLTAAPLDTSSLRRKISLQPIRNSSLFEVSVTDTDRMRATDIANGLAFAYNYQWTDTPGDSGMASLKSTGTRLKDLEIKLAAARKELRDAMKAAGMDPAAEMPVATPATPPALAKAMETHRVLKEQFNEARIAMLNMRMEQSATLNGNILKVVEAAAVPSGPGSPSHTLLSAIITTVCTGAGLLMGILWALSLGGRQE